MNYGTRLQWNQAPLEYRYALDVAALWLWQEPRTVWRCNEAALESDIIQRFPYRSHESECGALLWVEPLACTWERQLQEIAALLPTGSPLVIVSACPLARLLPERTGWRADVLGMAWGGVATLKTGLTARGFRIVETYGIHSSWAIIANWIGQLVARMGYTHHGDQWEFRARRWYTVRGLLTPVTVALLKAERL
jgi:hypothetical protein